MITLQQKQIQLFQRTSGKLKADLNLENLQKHLKANYSLGCKFSFSNSKTSTHKKFTTLEIHDGLLIADLVFHYSNQGINLEIFNQHGQSIPFDQNLKNASTYSFDVSEDEIFNTLLKSLDSISSNSNYSDVEWIKRIFMQAIRKSNNNEKRETVKDKLNEIYESNERFLKPDYEDILKHL